ncbi:MAG: DUF4124 domain-containing protein, partial [Casimicrobiaceae bacterium]
RGMMDILYAPDSQDRRDEVSVSMWLLPALLVGIILLAIATVAHAGVYKWTDDQGIVHYSDRLPPDDVNRSRVELNRDGVPIRKIGKAVPSAEHATSVAEQERDQQQAREHTVSARRDRALLDSYSSVAEVDLAKKRALSTLNAQIASASGYVADMIRRRDALLTEKAGYGTRPTPDGITRELRSIDTELARQQAFITAHRSEAATVTARYDADRLRYEDLTKSPSSSAASAAAGTELSAATQIPVVRN